MDGDDRSKTTLRTPNRHDVLVFGPRQSLKHFARLGSGQVTHDQILWAIESEKRSGEVDGAGSRRELSQRLAQNAPGRGRSS